MNWVAGMTERKGSRFDLGELGKIIVPSAKIWRSCEEK